MTRRTAWSWAVAGTFLVVLLLGRWVAVTSIERWWAEAVGFGDSNASIARLKVLLLVAAFVVAAAWCSANFFVVYRSIDSVGVHRHVGNLELLEAIPRGYVRAGLGTAGLLLAALLSRTSGDWWYHRALATTTESGSLKDPVLGRDIGFYVFDLPWFRELHGFALIAVVSVLAVSVVVYVALGAVRVRGRSLRIAGSARAHLGVLLAILALVLYWGYRLDPAEYVGGIHDVPYDAVLTEVRVPTAQMLGFLALIVCIVSAVWVRWGRGVLLVAAWSALALVSVLGHYVVPAFAGSVRSPGQLELGVDPGTLQQLTATAYGLPPADVAAVPAANPDLTVLRRYGLDLRSAPVWDAFAIRAFLNRAATQTPDERFSNVHLIRYENSGGESVPIYLGVRHLDFTRTRSGRSVSWEDVHIGPSAFPRGAVAVHAHATDALGRPRVVNDVAQPGMTDSVVVDVKLADPRVVFGPAAANVAFVAPDDVSGTHGVLVGGFWRRLAFGWSLQTPQLVLGDAVPRDARILWRRSVVARLERVAPFSTFGEPYPVIAEGRLYWIASGYVTSESFALSPASVWRGRDVRYLRAGFVGVVDAVTGGTSVYLVRDPDPLSWAWSQLTPDIVQPATAMPPFVINHMRYPAELFAAQAPMIRDALFDVRDRPSPLHLTRRRTGDLLPEPFWWVGRGLDDPTDRLRLRTAVDPNDAAVLGAMLEGTMRDGVATLSLVRFAEPVSVPTLSQLGGLRGRDFSRSSSAVSGAVRPVLLDNAVMFLLATYHEIPAAGGRPALLEVVVNWGPFVERGVSVIAALENAGRDSPPRMVSAAQWEEARRWFAGMDAARRVGDWVAFGRAYESFRNALADSTR